MGSFEAYSHTLFLPGKLVKTKLGAVKSGDVNGQSIAVSRELVPSANIMSSLRHSKQNETQKLEERCRINCKLDRTFLRLLEL